MAEPVPYEPDNQPPYEPPGSSIEPSGQMTEVSVAAATGVPNTRQLLHREKGLGKRSWVEKFPLLLPLRGVAEEVEALRSLPSAMVALRQLFTGQDAAPAVVVEGETVVPERFFEPGLLDDLHGYAAAPLEGGGTRPAYEGLIPEATDAFDDLDKTRESIYGPVNPTTRVKTGPGRLDLMELVLRHLAAEVAGPLNADGTPTGADGAVQVLTNAVKVVAELASPVNADGTAGAGDGKMDLLITQVTAVNTKLDTLNGHMATLASEMTTLAAKPHT